MTRKLKTTFKMQVNKDAGEEDGSEEDEDEVEELSMLC